MPPFGRRTASAGIITALMGVILTTPSWTEPMTVFVEPSQTVLRTIVTLESGARKTYALRLLGGTTLHYEVFVDGGLTDSVLVGLLDESNFRHLGQSEPYRLVPGTEQTVRRVGKYVFPVPRTDTYYLLIDNAAAWFSGRDVVVYAYVLYPQPTLWSRQFQRSTQHLYDSLKAWFAFADFKILYRHCGSENAFSNPDITICLELIEALRDEGLQGAYPFVLFHELGHSFLHVWGDARFADESVADEFAVMACILLDLQSNAREAARWFANRRVEINAGLPLWLVDRHALSPVRAQHILDQLDRPMDLMRRWQATLVSHLQTDYMRHLDQAPYDWVDHALLRAEMARRGADPSAPSRQPSKWRFKPPKTETENSAGDRSSDR